MATVTDTSSSASILQSWALPLAATILVAGSLVFWAMLGMVWLAARPVPQPPIVVLLDSARSAEPVGSTLRSTSVGSALHGVPQSKLTVNEMVRNGTEAVPYRREHDDATAR